jgi:TonB family protein
VQGRVILNATLSEGGNLENIQVVASPDPRLSELAVKAFRTWRYKPARCGGKPVQVYITSTMSFNVH